MRKKNKKNNLHFSSLQTGYHKHFLCDWRSHGVEW
jgi:hypothetical protein